MPGFGWLCGSLVMPFRRHWVYLATFRPENGSRELNTKINASETQRHCPRAPSLLCPRPHLHLPAAHPRKHPPPLPRQSARLLVCDAGVWVLLSCRSLPAHRLRRATYSLGVSHCAPSEAVACNAPKLESHACQSATIRKCVQLVKKKTSVPTHGSALPLCRPAAASSPRFGWLDWLLLRSSLPSTIGCSQGHHFLLVM